MKTPCYKQQVVAVLTNRGKVWVGTNGIDNPAGFCHRTVLGCASGEGYEYCSDVCEQVGHAEAVVCNLAGEEGRGGTLHLFGHTYACDACIELMKSFGIRELRIHLPLGVESIQRVADL